MYHQANIYIRPRCLSCASTSQFLQVIQRSMSTVLRTEKHGKGMAAGPQLIMYYNPKKVLPFGFFNFLTRPAKTGKESFLRQILLSNLRFVTCMSGSKQKYG